MDFGAIDSGWILINVILLLFSLSLHESAHAWMADRLGDSTARSLGRVTLNPLVHIDPVGTVLFPILGLLSGWALFGWARPVPVHTAYLQNPKRDHLLIAAAGPLSNVLAALGFLLGLKLLGIVPSVGLGASGAVISRLLQLCQLGILLNVILAVFNLIPIPPLDGSWILRGILPDRLGSLLDWVRPYSFVLLMILLMSGFLTSVLGPVLALVQVLL